MITWILVVIAVIAAYLLFQSSRRPENYPPGPRSWPLVGMGPHLAQKGKLPHEAVWELGQKHGPVIGGFFGSHPVCLVTGYKACRESLTNEAIAGRPRFFTFNSFEEQRLGILTTDGDFWKEQRRFMLWHLRDFGFGKGQVEPIIHEEVSDLLQDMDTRSSELILVADLFGVSIINVLWAMMAGERYPYGDQGLRTTLGYVDAIFRAGNPTGGPWAGFPQLRKFFSNLSGYAETRRNQLALEGFIREKIQHHKETFDENAVRDFMDTFLKEMKDQSTFTEDQLVALCMDMFMAGSETTSNFLIFAVLYMVLHPDVQRKVQDELDRVVGPRLPSLKDRMDLPYTEATLMEIFRMGSIAPFAVPHRAMSTTQLMGYTIPQNTLFIINLWSAHMDQEHFGDPDNFRPERFIKDGKFQKDDWLMPFGIGKRSCAGESLARATSFLFFTALFQKFNVSVAPGREPPSMRPLGGFTLTPKPFSVKVVSRG